MRRCDVTPTLRQETRRRRAGKAENGLGHAPAARTIVRLMTLEHNNLTKAQKMTVAAIEERLPDLVEAGDVIESFHKMLRSKSKDDLEARAARSFVASFANGIIRDWGSGPERDNFNLVERPDRGPDHQA
ncbi:hypothetical protein ATN84_23160 [Paramesorhizobium deserti]|uniref:Uncharacterized protein n=2 Tax=Paramesorhizobium deserti TaxID=1494590 RepID=A0A135HNK6_9HYPH|nr:hypothetical protein ATN84_23160 [Paramesorhizobium deserti]